MKTKNIFKKTINLSVAIVLFSLMLTPTVYGSTTLPSNECDGIRFFLSVIVVIFLALILWAVSPVGVLFFLSAKTLFSKSSSTLKRKFAMVAQVIAFLTWISVMFLLFLVYADSVSYKILDLGGEVLNLAIISGLAFFVVMITVMFIEKATSRCDNNKSNSNSGNSKNIPKRNKKSDDNIKFAGIEFGGTKRKVKRKIKEGIKEIINDKIDKL